MSNLSYQPLDSTDVLHVGSISQKSNGIVVRAMGIICSLDCYNVLIEKNTGSNSAGSGIMFSRNMTTTAPAYLPKFDCSKVMSA